MAAILDNYERVLTLVPTENRDLTSDHEDVYNYKELMGRDLAFPKYADGLVPEN